MEKDGEIMQGVKVKHSRFTRAVSFGVAVVVAGLALGGCEAKPGVAAYGKNVEITEQEINQVSAELGKYINIDRTGTLYMLAPLKYGGDKFLKDCPQLEDISAADFKIPVDKLSETAINALTLRLCQLAANPADAKNLGVTPTSPETIRAFAQLVKKMRADTTLKLSPRERNGLELSQQRQLARQGVPMTQD